jgi:hypothetical protein
MNIVCPYCNSQKGFYVLERAHRYLIFDKNGNPDGATDDVCDYSGRVGYCRECERMIPKNILNLEDMK